MSAPPPPPLLAPEHVELIARGVSTIVASHDLAHRPSLMRALGSTITPDGRQVTVFLSRRQSRQLLSDISSTGHLAVVFSEPASHRTVQVKSRRPRLRAAQPDDAPALARYRQAMTHELSLVGFAPAFAQAMLAGALEDLVAVSFEPDEAYDQTPGPKAGRALGGDGGTA